MVSGTTIGPDRQLGRERALPAGVAAIGKGARRISVAGTSRGWVRLRLSSQTSSTITLGWAPQPGYEVPVLRETSHGLAHVRMVPIDGQGSRRAPPPTKLRVIAIRETGRYPPRPLITVSTGGDDSTCRRSDGSRPCRTSTGRTRSRDAVTWWRCEPARADQAILETAVGAEVRPTYRFRLPQGHW